jgi:hypothetical protein
MHSGRCRRRRVVAKDPTRFVSSPVEPGGDNHLVTAMKNVR